MTANHSLTSVNCMLILPVKCNQVNTAAGVYFIRPLICLPLVPRDCRKSVPHIWSSPFIECNSRIWKWKTIYRQFPIAEGVALCLINTTIIVIFPWIPVKELLKWMIVESDAMLSSPLWELYIKCSRRRLHRVKLSFILI